MVTPTALDIDPAPGGQAAPVGGAAPVGREGRRAEAVILAIIFGGAASEVIALCAPLW
jgi:hypothetical protein